jgi:O-antigen/teichoic acid export membrane protein
VTDAALSSDYPDVKQRALVGGRALALRYLVVGIISLGGSTILIRSLGAKAWATYSVGYFLITFIDQNIGARLLGSIVRWPGVLPVGLLRSAAGLMQVLGGALFLLLVGAGFLATGLSSLEKLGLCLASVGVCAYVYASRTLPLVLLERVLEYRWIAVGEIVDQLTFYVVAIPLVLGGEGLKGVALAFAVRGIPTAVLLHVRSRAPLVGRAARGEVREILHFAGPTLGLASLILVEGLTPFLVLGGGHARDLAFFMTSSSLVGYAAVVQTVVQRVGFPSFSLVAGAGGELARTANRTSGAAVFALVSLVVPVAGLSPVWLPILLGSDWKSASILMVAIGAGFVLNGPISVLSGALYSLGHPRDVFRVYVTMTLAYVVLAVAGVQVSPLAGAGVAYVMSRALGLALMRLDVARRGCPVAMRGTAAVIAFATVVAAALAMSVWHGEWLGAAAVIAVALPVWTRGLARNRTLLLRAFGLSTPNEAAVGD